MARRFGKKNKVKLDPFSYNSIFLGESGIGKTTLVYNMLKKYVGEEGYLFLECGKEDGEEAIEGINAVKVLQWDEVDEDTVDFYASEDVDVGGFEEIIDSIIENKNELYPDLKVVVIDTYDELLKIAEPYVIELHNREHPDKRTTSIKAAFGGFMGGEDKCDEICLNKLWELKKVGVHFIIIGHVKRKDKEDAITGLNYSTITASMGDRHFNAIKTKAHFCGVCFIDRDIVAQKTGKKNVVTKKEEVRGKITGESRKVIFRDDNYSVDSKSRFADITNEKMPLDADTVYDAMVDAIRKEKEKNGVNIDNASKEQENQHKKQEEIIKKRENVNRSVKELSETIAKIKKTMMEHSRDKEFITMCTQSLKDMGYSSFTDINVVEDAKKLLDKISNI